MTNPRGFISGATLWEWTRYGCLACAVFLIVTAAILVLKFTGHLP